LNLNFAGPPASAEGQAFHILSYQDVVDGSFDPALVSNKIVLVGVMAAAEPDSYLVPVSQGGRPMFGVEILANALETVWSRRFVRTPDSWVQIALVLALGALTGLLLNVRPWAGLGLAVALVLVYFVAAMWLFDRQGWLLSLLYPTLAIMMSFVLVTVYRYSLEVRERRKIMRLFEARVTPQVAQATMKAVQRGEINLGGEVQEVSVMFADMRNFTRFSETHTPEEVMGVVNTFLGMIAEIVFDSEGTLAHYEGDQAMAIFNAPLAQPDHALRAVKTALAAKNRVTQYIDSLPEDHPYKAISFGYGIYTGRAIVGHSGNPQRYEYTALGDTINIASRLTSTADAGQILLGAPTFERVQGEVIVMEMPTLAVRGRVAPIAVYELLSVERLV
jgi:adenylate cyclase